VHSLDILVWTDAFWCFREELLPEFLHGQDYRVVEPDTDEWYRFARSKQPTGSS